MANMGRLLAEGVTFFRLQELIRVAISLADSEVYERIGKCVISVCKKAQRDSADDHTVYLSWQENILCIITLHSDILYLLSPLFFPAN